LAGSLTASYFGFIGSHGEAVTVQDQFDRLKSALAERYAIERELGSGGMATVYLAEDLKHHRKVAVKVLRPELAAALGADRFHREIEIAANLHHPHILPLHDSGEAEGFLYYVMPYVEGESLRDRLNREKQLPVDDALQIARDVADALGSAHKHDVIHRDIKPENILLEEGHAIVADFGIARAVDVAGGTKLTETGIALGTPEYMSPEQAAGGTDLDGRSDIYSLGCVLYEMLGGQPPFTGVTVESIVSQHMTAEPAPVTQVRPAVSAEIVGTLNRMLAKTPADRFGTAGQFSEALAGVERTPTVGAAPVAVSEKARRKVIAYAAIAILAIIGAYTVIFRTVGPSELAVVAEPPKLAVLPFNNLGSLEDEYFADGITEEITSRIAEISGLRVISRQSAVQYKNSDKTLRQIGEELGVDYVLEGTIRTDRSPEGSGQVRVTPQLIRVVDDAHLWTDRYTAGLVPGEIFGVQEEIANRVAEALDVTLLEPERGRLAAKPTDNQQAYDYYLRGKDYASRGYRGEDLRIAVQMYARAVELDQEFAVAFASLSRAHSLLYWFRHDRTEQRLNEAKAAAERALELGPDLPEAHLALGYYYYWGLLDYDRALEQFAIVQKSRSNDADFLLALGNVEFRQGDWERALRNNERAAELDPRSYTLLGNLGVKHIYTRNYPEAERYLDRATSLAPDLATGYAIKALLYLSWQGSTERTPELLREASEQVDTAELISWLASWFNQRAFFRLDSAYQQALDGLSAISFGRDSGAYFLAKAATYGQRSQPEVAHAYYDSARVALEALVQALPEDAVFHGQLGLAYAGVGRREEAIALGERAVELLPVAKDAGAGQLHVQSLAEIYTMVGEYAAAIDQLEYLLSIPSLMSAPLLRADPLYDSLRSDPRFQALLEKYDTSEK
jgi:serine/threonine-protein kinase